MGDDVAGTSSLQVVDWDKHFEKSESRKIKSCRWVPLPNDMADEEYISLVEDHPNGPAHFGAWCAILEIASRQDEHRGLIISRLAGKISQDAGRFSRCTSGISRYLGKISRFPSEIFDEAIPRLVSLGWIKVSESSGKSPDVPADHQENLPARRENFRITGQDITEHNRTGQDKTEQRARENAETAMLEECEWLYQQAGVPVAPKQRQMIIQLMISMDDDVRGRMPERLPNYIKWALATGRWKTPATTKSLLNLVSEGDWDVELTQRTLPQAKTATAANLAEERFLNGSNN